MVPHTAVGIHTTQTRTRVLTLSVDACFVLRTFRVNNTLRSAVGRRSNHLRETGTVTGGAIVLWRVGVRTTGIWDAGVLHYDWSNC